MSMLIFFKKLNFKTFDYDFKEWSEIRCIFASYYNICYYFYLSL